MRNMRTTRRYWLLSLAGALFFSNRGCVGTNTGNAECPPPDACKMPVIITGTGREWRGTASFEMTERSIRLSASAVTNEDGKCKWTSDHLDGAIPLLIDESSATSDGGLSVQFVDPRLNLSWRNTRPRLFENNDTNYSVYAMQLDVSPDGMLTASLEVVEISLSFSVDAGVHEKEVGTFTIEGPLSVACDPGEEFREIPVASGSTAKIRCAIVTGPESGCDDTPDNSVWRCSMTARR